MCVLYRLCCTGAVIYERLMMILIVGNVSGFIVGSTAWVPASQTPVLANPRFKKTILCNPDLPVCTLPLLKAPFLKAPSLKTPFPSKPHFQTPVFASNAHLKDPFACLSKEVPAFLVGSDPST